MKDIDKEIDDLQTGTRKTFDELGTRITALEHVLLLLREQQLSPLRGDVPYK